MQKTLKHCSQDHFAARCHRLRRLRRPKTAELRWARERPAIAGLAGANAEVQFLLGRQIARVVNANVVDATIKERTQRSLRQLMCANRVYSSPRLHFLNYNSRHQLTLSCVA